MEVDSSNVDTSPPIGPFLPDHPLKQSSSSPPPPPSTSDLTKASEEDSTEVKEDVEEQDKDDDNNNKAPPELNPPADLFDDTRLRVKVYVLKDDNWLDSGTGHVMTGDGPGRDVIFTVMSEDTGTALLTHCTADCEKYNRQQDTLIVWTDKHDKDYSLSFQEKAGCDDMWSKLCSIKGGLVSSDEIGFEEESDSSEGSVSLELSETRHDPEQYARVKVPELPEPDMGNLEKWEEIFVKLTSQKLESNSKNDRDLREVVQRKYEQLADQMMKNDNALIKKLFDTFEQCEDLEDDSGLVRCFNIMSGLFYMCNASIFEVLFDEKSILHTVGMMEYDPVRKRARKHRDHLTNKAVFKEVVEMKDTELVKQIHQAYRIQYIKDVIFSGVLDDHLQNTINSFVYYNHVDVCNKLRTDKSFLEALFKTLADTTAPPEIYRDRILLLKEFCVLGKNLLSQETQNGPSLYQVLADNGMFELFQLWLVSTSLEIRKAALEILSIFQISESNLVFDAILRPKRPLQKATVLHVCAKQFRAESQTVLVPQLIHAIKCMVEVDEIPQASDKTKLLQMFYGECIGSILEPLQWDLTNEPDMLKHEKVNYAICFLATAIPAHTYHVKNYVMREGVIQAAVKHLSSGKNVVVLATLRLLRVIVGLKNEFYSRYLIKNSLFTQMVELLVVNGPKYNMLNSCILDLLEFVKQENIKSLVQHFAEAHGEELRKLGYIKTVVDLLNRHEQNTEPLKTEVVLHPLSLATEDRKKRDTTMSVEEEDYWDDDNEADTKKTKRPHEDDAADDDADEPSLPAFKPRKRLVKYDDDDDDDDMIFALASKQLKK